MPASEFTRAAMTTCGVSGGSPSVRAGAKMRRNTLDCPFERASARTTNRVCPEGCNCTSWSPSGKTIFGESRCTNTVMGTSQRFMMLNGIDVFLPVSVMPDTVGATTHVR